MERIYNQLSQLSQLQMLSDKLMPSGVKINVDGLDGALSGFLAAFVLRNMQTSVLMIVSSPKEAEAALDDVVSILGADRVGYLPGQYRNLLERKSIAAGPRNERTDALLRLKSANPNVLVTLPEALPMPE